MIYAWPQTEHAVSELQAVVKTAENAKWYRRLKIIQFSMAGSNVPQLRKQFEVCTPTIRNDIKAYNANGIQGLIPNKSPGRLPKVGHLSRDQWTQILSQTPNQYDKLSTDSRQWTLELLARYASKYLDRQVTLDTISKALRRCKYRTGRSKLRVGSPDPDYLVKRENVETLTSMPPRGN